MISQEQLLDTLRERVKNASNYCECSVLDYKVKPHDTSTYKCDFLKDVLSLLNSWERPDEDRFLIFGVEDQGRKPVGYCIHDSLDDATVQTLITKYISPRPVVEFHEFSASQILGSSDKSGKLFGCLYIPASNFGEVYEISEIAIDKVKDKNDKRFRRFEVGTSFARNGSQVIPLTQKHRDELKAIRRKSKGFDANSMIAECDANGFPIICLASVIGSWDESVEGDKKLIEDLSGMPYSNFIAAIRKQSIRDNGMISAKGTTWNVGYREEILSHFSLLLSKPFLSSLQECFALLLCDTDTRFDLEPDERFAAALYGATTLYSSAIKQGVSSFLAIIGTYPNLCNCSKQDVTNFIFTLQSALLSSDNWKTIASASEVLPLLSEAYPEGFLVLVERNAKPGTGLTKYLSQKEEGFLSSNYGQELFIGIRLAAIDENNFSRSMSVLQKIRSFSKFADQAMEALLLPWCPQTAASSQTRKGAAVSLLRCGAWTTLIQLLPNVKTTGSFSIKPTFRKEPCIPDSVSYEDFWTVSRAYVSAAITYATEKVDETLDLIKHIGSIASSGYTDEFVSSIIRTCTNVDKINAVRIWSALETYLRKCRKYADASWLPKQEVIDALEEAVKTLKPTDSMAKAIHLFSHNDFDLIDDDWDIGIEKLHLERIAALDALFSVESDEALDTLSLHCADKRQLGAAIAESKPAKNACSDVLYSAIAEKNEVASGFVWKSYHLEGEDYLKLPRQLNWEKSKALAFYCLLPCNREVWQAAEAFLEKESVEYWRNAPASFDAENASDADHVLSNYLEVSRCGEALVFGYRCIEKGLTLNKTLLFECIKNYSPGPNPGLEIHFFDTLFQYVSGIIEPSEIAWQQFRMYSLLEDKDNLLLHRQMSTDPEFFALVLRLAYRKADFDQNMGDLPSRAYEVLWRWRSIPGICSDNRFDVNLFHSWIEQVENNIRNDDLVSIFHEKLGECLFHAPADEDGLFIITEIAEFLDGNEYAQTGYSIESVNSRGATFIDGKGTAHYELSNLYLSRAKEIESMGLYGFGATLRSMAQESIRDAEREIMLNEQPRK